MGTIVRFDRTTRARSAQTGTMAEGRVIMFTGIRYERDKSDDPSGKKQPVPVPRGPGSGPGTKRKRRGG